jgi:hypothetical protein
MKFVEIAQVLGCPLNTALGRMHKAVIRLRQLMERETEVTDQKSQDRDQGTSRLELRGEA